MSKKKSAGQQRQQLNEAPKNSRTDSPLAELAAERGTTEADVMSVYLSSLEVHGESVESRIGEEFRPWLLRFAKVLDSDVDRTNAWEQLKSKCDVLLLLRDLYLFTYPGHSKRTSADFLKEGSRFLKDELDKLIPRYATLHRDTSELLAHPKLKLIGALSSEAVALFNEPLSLLQTVQRELTVIREWAGKMASLKTDANDLYLYSMAARLRDSTGQYYFSELTTLIESALAAHGGADHEALDQKTLERRVQRYINRMNLPRYEPPSKDKD